MSDAQEDIAQQQTDHMVRLASPMQNVMAGRQQGAGDQSGRQKNRTQAQTDRVDRESQIGLFCWRDGHLRWQILVARQDAGRSACGKQIRDD